VSFKLVPPKERSWIDEWQVVPTTKELDEEERDPEDYLIDQDA
jgi:hypothetical protein